MPVWLDIIIYGGFFILIFLAHGLSKQVSEQEEEVAKQRRLIIHLNAELERANREIKILKQSQGKESKAKANKIPDFLLADDPMETLYRQIGVSR